MIEVKGLYKSFGGSTILKDISASFEKGKTNLIIGQSGSGKTVFLKCLLGLFDYEEGTISYDGKTFASSTLSPSREALAILFSSTPHLPVIPVVLDWRDLGSHLDLSQRGMGTTLTKRLRKGTISAHIIHRSPSTLPFKCHSLMGKTPLNTVRMRYNPSQPTCACHPERRNRNSIRQSWPHNSRAKPFFIPTLPGPP